MKKRLMIFCNLISLLLVGFQFPIYAEEDPSDTPSSVPVPNSIRLDQYFFDNYFLLPYIESDGSQYINTGIHAKDNLKINFSISDFSTVNEYSYVFGNMDSNTGRIIVFKNPNQTNSNTLVFYNNISFASYEYLPYNIYNFSLDNNEYYMNNVLLHSFPSGDFESSDYMYIFANSHGDSASSFKLYNLSIYDYDTESYVRYYYPAKSKSGGVIGLYDAVSDTFVTTSGSVPFASPIDDQVLNFQIGSFLTAGLEWIGDILEFVVEIPIIMIFMAIGLAGAMFRWGRRLVHF